MASGATHLLRGDEFGHSPGDVGVGVGEELAVAIGAADTQGVGGHVGDVSAVRVEMRVIGAVGRRWKGDVAGDEVGGGQLATKGEGCLAARFVDCKGSDALGRFAQPFAPGSLGGWQVAVAGVERTGIDNAVFGAGRDVEHPQSGGRVVAGR